MAVEQGRWASPVEFEISKLNSDGGLVRVGYLGEQAYFSSLVNGMTAAEAGFAYYIVGGEIVERDARETRCGFVRPDGLWGQIQVETFSGEGVAILGLEKSAIRVCFNEGGFVGASAGVAIAAGRYGERRLSLTADKQSNVWYAMEQEMDGEYRTVREGECHLASSTLLLAACVKCDKARQADVVYTHGSYRTLYEDKLAKLYQVGAFRSVTKDQIKVWTVRMGKKLEWNLKCDMSWGGAEDMKPVYDRRRNKGLSEEVMKLFDRLGEFRQS